MRIVRENLVTGREEVARYSGITTSTGSAFTAEYAKEEAEKIGGRVESTPDILSGRAVSTVYGADGVQVSRYVMEWPVEDDEENED